MSRRSAVYARLCRAAAAQPTGWLVRCFADPGPHMNALALAAVRRTLRSRAVAVYRPASAASVAVLRAARVAQSLPAPGA